MDYKKNYALWLDALRGTEYEQSLLELASDEAQLSDSFYREMEFGTAGMRGVIGMGTNRMNVFTVRRATQALANHIISKNESRRGVAIAYDTRHLSDVFAQNVAGVLLKNGIKVYLYSTPHSVPQLSFAILQKKCAAGVVITASHNPPEYNGYKVYGEDGGQMSVEDSNQITKNISEIGDMFRIEPLSLDGGHPMLEMLGDEIDEIYYQKVQALCIHPEIVKKQAEKLNIVYTPLYGTGLVPVRHILTSLGVNKLHIVPEQEKPNPAFPTVKAPNPEERDSFSLAIALANQKGANLILATDPDSDRLGVAVRNHSGEFVILTGNEIGCLLIDYILSQTKSAFTGDEFIVKSIVSTDMADTIAASYHVESRSVFTGFKYIAQQIKLSEETGKGKFQFGFEESYGYLRGPFVRDKDAVQGAMLVAEAACYYAETQSKGLYDAVMELYQKYGWFSESVLSKVLVGREGLAKIQKAVDTLRNNIPSALGPFQIDRVRDYYLQTIIDKQAGRITPIENMEKSNVLYFELPNARFILRPSGTEPKLKAYLSVKAGTREEAATMLQSLEEAATRLIESLLQ